MAGAEPTGEPIHVALAFDDNFWAPAYATMRSVCLSTHRRKDLVFHLFNDGLQQGHRLDLEEIRREFDATVTYHDLAQITLINEIVSKVHVTSVYPRVIYARLMIDRVLDRSVRRVTFIDCDVLVRAPIERLAQSELSGKPIGAVQDISAWWKANGRDVNKKSEIFDPADPYFNSGVLVIDLEAWRNADVMDRLARLEREGSLDKAAYVQDILNLLFKGEWAPVDPMWNAFNRGRTTELLHPHLVHYTGVNKPWNLVSGVPFARVYRHVMTNELFWRYLRYRWARYWLGLPRRLFGAN